MIDDRVVTVAGSEHSPIEIRAYPRDDEAFLGKLLGSLRAASRVRGLERLCTRLQSALAEDYPSVKVRPQDPLAAGSGTVTVVYAYRDGFLIPEDAATAARGRD